MVDFDRTILQRVTTLDEAQAVIKETAGAVKRAGRANEKATVKAAYAARIAVAQGILVVGKGAKRHPHTEKAVDYGHRFENAKGGGVGQSMVNLWVTGGFALVDCGVPEDSDLFAHIMFRGAGFKTDVSEVIRAGKPLAEVEAAVRKHIDADGNAVKRIPAAKSGEGSESGEGSGSGSVPPVRSNVGLVAAALATIEARVPELTDEEWWSLETALGAATKALSKRSREARKARTEAETADALGETA